MWFKLAVGIVLRFGIVLILVIEAFERIGQENVCWYVREVVHCIVEAIFEKFYQRQWISALFSLIVTFVVAGQSVCNCLLRSSVNLNVIWIVLAFLKRLLKSGYELI